MSRQLCEFPVKVFGSIKALEGIIVMGECGSGRTLMSYDIVASLLKEGKRVVLVMDEPTWLESLSKLSLRLKLLFNPQGITESDLNGVDDKEYAIMIHQGVTVFDSLDALRAGAELGLLKDYDAIVCDTTPFGVTKELRSGVVYGQLLYLQELRNRFDLFTSYTIQARSGGAPQGGVVGTYEVDYSLVVNRIIYTIKEQDNLVAKEYDFTSNELTVPIIFHTYGKHPLTL
jgi:hypothetical protein